jgi:hypothetical protein
MRTTSGIVISTCMTVWYFLRNTHKHIVHLVLSYLFWVFWNWHNGIRQSGRQNISIFTVQSHRYMISGWMCLSCCVLSMCCNQSTALQTEDLGGGMPCCKTVFFKLEDLCCFRCFLWSCNYFLTSIEPDCPFVSAVQQRRQKMAWTLVSR